MIPAPETRVCPLLWINPWKLVPCIIWWEGRSQFSMPKHQLHIINSTITWRIWQGSKKRNHVNWLWKQNWAVASMFDWMPVPCFFTMTGITPIQHSLLSLSTNAYHGANPWCTSFTDIHLENTDSAHGIKAGGSITGAKLNLSHELLTMKTQVERSVQDRCSRSKRKKRRAEVQLRSMRL